MEPRDDVAIKAGERAEDCRVLGTLAFGNPETVLTELEPTLGPFPTLVFPFNITAVGW